MPWYSSLIHYPWNPWFLYFYPGWYPHLSNLYTPLWFANNVDESGTMIANKQSCPHRNFRRKFPAFEIKRQRTLSVRSGGGRIHYPRRENGKGYNAVLHHGFHGLKRISRIKSAWSIKSQAHPTDECHDIHHSFIIRAIRGFYFSIQDDILTLATFTPPALVRE